MSTFSPTIGAIALAYPLDNLSNSPSDNSRGSAIIPPLPPPKGTPTTPHLKVIHVESALTSSICTSGWILMPPLKGPIASLCCALYPKKVLTFPSSIFTGIVTSSVLIGFLSISNTAGSVPSLSHTVFTCC